MKTLMALFVATMFALPAIAQEAYPKNFQFLFSPGQPIVTCVLEFEPPPLGVTEKSVNPLKFGAAGLSDPPTWI